MLLPTHNVDVEVTCAASHSAWAEALVPDNIDMLRSLENNAIKAKCKTSWGHPSQKPYNYHLDLLQVQRNSSFFVALQTVHKTTKFKYRAKLEFAWSPSKVKSWAKPLSIYPLFWSSPIFTYWQYNLSVTVANYLVKGDEVNGDALLNAIVDFLNIYVIVLLQ